MTYPYPHPEMNLCNNIRYNEYLRNIAAIFGSLLEMHIVQRDDVPLNLR